MSSAQPATLSHQPSPEEADRRFLWHPFTQMQEYANNPRLHVARAEGCWLMDQDGKRYLDGNASIWTNVHGHHDPDLDQALRAQLDQVAHVTLLGLNHPTASALAEQLAGLTQGALPRCFYTDNGAGAVEVALKLSFQYWQLKGRAEKTDVVSFVGAYHGDTFGTMAVGERSAFHVRFNPWLFPVHQVAVPSYAECAGEVLQPSNGLAELQALEQLLKKSSGQIACLILEPRVQGAAGMRQQPAGWVRGVAELCRRYEVHLILDEVFTGFGRLGSLTVAETENVTPDFLCLAKGLAAGYLPLAATLTSQAIYEAFLGSYSSGKTFFHGHTFSGNPLGCAVALASLKKLKPLIASGRPAESAQALGQGLKACFMGHRQVHGIRQLGLTAAIDFGAETGQPAWQPDDRTAYRICLAARRHGLVLRPLGDSILIVPPIVITPSEVQHLLQALQAATSDILS
jgi:adenosylmethionine-8-amino-7-oxononanoate aminotransferase